MYSDCNFRGLSASRPTPGLVVADVATTAVGRERSIRQASKMNTQIAVRKAGVGCGFNRWTQHLLSEYREEDVVDEVPEEDLLHRN